MNKRNANYALIKLMEEAGEMIQLCSKVIYYGIDNVSPKGGNTHTNRDKLIEEMGDVLALMKIIVNDTDLDISMADVKKRRDEKYIKLEGYIPEAEC